jgi:LAGLIDADG endonuclease
VELFPFLEGRKYRGKNPLKSVDKTAWSYLAGLFDGEGTFSIYQNSGKYKVLASGQEKQYNFTNSRVEITNTNIELMGWLVSNFGGVYYTHRRAKSVHKTAYSWRPKGKKNTEELILGILPYLVIKKKQASIILEYIRLGSSCGTERRDVERRFELMRECQALNKRGFSVETNTLDSASSDAWKIESELTGDSESTPTVM